MGRNDTTPWWHGAVGYQAYIRSFADSSGDGMGDLGGIVSKLDHLQWLGVDALWINPFMPSPGHDHGYDVSGYCDVDQRHGTLADFDQLVDEAGRRDIRIIVDVVPNHTSNEHPWFVSALGDRDSEYRDHYIWADPAPGGGPPNNWVQHFGGPAWTLDPETDQYYCHLFLPEQPDLNWRNPAVADAFEDILRFWFDRGAVGVRIDVAHGCSKDWRLRDNPQIREITSSMSPRHVFDSFDHVHDLDQDDNIEIFRRWNKIADEYGAVLIGEIGAENPERAARYVNDGTALHQLFYLPTTWHDWDPPSWKRTVEDLYPIAETGVSWVLSCHDRPRPVTRFGGTENDHDQAVRRSLALSTLFMTLGGMPFLYMGEELGLPDGQLHDGELADPLAARFPDWAHEGRDGCRTPMPWTVGANNGFTTGTPWLRSLERPDDLTLEGQMADPSSPVHRYRSVLAVRRSCPQLVAEPASFEDLRDDVVVVRRPDAVVVANLGTAPIVVDIEADFELVFDSAFESTLGAVDVTVEVAGESTSVLVRR